MKIQRALKQILDLGLALILLPFLLAPLLLLSISGAIALKSNPFFIQRRPGRYGRIFRLIKFKTMRDLRDARGDLLSDAQRITKYGRWLRATSADELPQLINILKGDMSFVGPRPLLPEYLPYYSTREQIRHQVRPGITGLAQINGRNATTWEQRLQLDIAYVENWSLKEDAKIFKDTFIKVLQKEGADVIMPTLNSVRSEGLKKHG